MSAPMTAARAIAAASMPGEDYCSGLVVRAVVPVPHGAWYACYADGVEEFQLEVIAWADCVRPDGTWAGLLAVVPEDGTAGTIATPESGFKRITHQRRGQVR